MVVVDTSAIVSLLLEEPPATALRVRLTGLRLSAPHLIDVEFLHALRRLVRTGLVAPTRGAVIRSDFSSLRITRYPHTLLSDRMWELRENLTAYDAAFVALAEALDVPLVTADARLAAAPGHSATIEVY